MAHTHKLVDGVRIELTQEEKNEIALKEAAWDDGAFDRAMENLRIKRNMLLAETDWWGASDNIMTDAQKKYRQDLRDLTTGLDTVEKVANVTWPTKP